jgi:hypothetical protein
MAGVRSGRSGGRPVTTGPPGPTPHGSGELLRWLLERDLVDELNLQRRRRPE